MDLIFVSIQVFIILVNSLVVFGAIQKSLSIINGNDATVDEAPFMVGLLQKPKKTHFCGGAIIAKRWIATAHHCVKKRTPDQIVAAVGSVELRKGTYYDIRHKVSYPGYPRSDFALLKTKTEIVFTQYVNKISLRNAEIPANTVAREYGWGRTEVRTDYNFNKFSINLSIAHSDRTIYESQALAILGHNHSSGRMSEWATSRAKQSCLHVLLRHPFAEALLRRFGWSFSFHKNQSWSII